ncbi:endonuclease, partial [Kineococcus sp. T13]|nr:endonuclease [Kineococcus vitellinus]
MPSRTRAARLTGGCVALGVAGAALTALGLPVASAAAPSAPFISEISYDNSAPGDRGEFIEVQLPAGTSSSGLSLVLYNGNGGGVYDTDALPDVTAPADAPAVAVVEYAGTLQNGEADGVALVRGTEVLELLSYEGTLTATAGPAAGRTSTDIGVAQANGTPEGQSLQRVHVAAADALAWSASAPATRGAVNAPA